MRYRKITAEESGFASQLEQKIDDAFSELRTDLDEILWKKINALEADLLDESKEFLAEGKLDTNKILSVLNKSFTSNVGFLETFFEWHKVKNYFNNTAKKVLKAEQERLDELEEMKELNQQ